MHPFVSPSASVPSVALMILVTWPTGPAAAALGEPLIAFDFAHTVSCEVTASDALADTGERVIEARFQISARVTRGSLDDVDEIEIEIRGLTSRFSVVGFAPRTQMTSDYLEPLVNTHTVEKSRTLGASLGGSLSLPAGVSAQITPSVSGATTNRESATESSTRVPPLEATVVSGTLDSGHGAFFKIRRSSQTTLEGTHTVTVRFAVPANWLADVVLVRCRAKGTKSWLWLEQNRQWSESRRPVALYLGGEPSAKVAAARKMRSYRRRCACASGD